MDGGSSLDDSSVVNLGKIRDRNLANNMGDLGDN